MLPASILPVWKALLPVVPIERENTSLEVIKLLKLSLMIKISLILLVLPGFDRK